AHARLNLVGQEQSTGGVAQLARGCEELLRDGTHPALALDRLNADAAHIARKLRAQVGDVVKADEVDIGHYGSERLAILLLVGGRDRAHGAAVEAVLDGKKLRAELLSFAAQHAGMRARQLQ